MPMTALAATGIDSLGWQVDLSESRVCSKSIKHTGSMFVSSISQSFFRVSENTNDQFELVKTNTSMLSHDNSDQRFAPRMALGNNVTSVLWIAYSLPLIQFYLLSNTSLPRLR